MWINNPWKIGAKKERIERGRKWPIIIAGEIRVLGCGESERESEGTYRKWMANVETCQAVQFASGSRSNYYSRMEMMHESLHQTFTYANRRTRWREQVSIWLKLYEEHHVFLSVSRLKARGMRAGWDKYKRDDTISMDTALTRNKGSNRIAIHALISCTHVCAPLLYNFNGAYSTIMMLYTAHS